jgi:predicted Zn-dependent protease with MMP-like domain
LKYRAPVHCVEHQVDLAALSRFVDDERPSGDRVTIDAISRGECPACRPRYISGWASPAPAAPGGAKGGLDPSLAGWTAISRVACTCCRTTWELLGPGWVATVGGGLRIAGRARTIPAGETIDSSWFVVDPFDPIGGPEQALRGECLAFDAATGVPATDDLVEDVTESMLAAYRGKADEDAELGRIQLEHHLAESAAEGWSRVALGGLRVIRGLLDEKATAGSPSTHTTPGIHISRERFEELVSEALDSIPPELARHMENVAVVVEDEARTAPHAGRLFGLYHGVPLTGRRGYGGATPDRITIYQDPICQYCRTESEVADQVRRTVIHEVGHHFGISDARLRQLGW